MKNENKKEMLKKDRNEKLKTLGWILFGVLTSVIGCVLLHVIGAFANEDRKEYWKEGTKKAWIGCFCWLLFTFAKCSINTQKELERIQTEETLNKVFGNIGKNY